MNLVLRPGERAPAALVASVDEGLYVVSTRNVGGINPISGDYSVGAARPGQSRKLQGRFGERRFRRAPVGCGSQRELVRIVGTRIGLSDVRRHERRVQRAQSRSGHLHLAGRDVLLVA